MTSTFVLAHRHAESECRFAFAAWRGFESPLRHGTVVGSCARGGHQLWWLVEAADPQSALALLPGFLAARTEAIAVDRLPVP